MSNCDKCHKYQLAMAYLQKDVKRLADQVRDYEKELKSKKS